MHANNDRIIAERDELKTRSLVVAERPRAMLQVIEYVAKSISQRHSKFLTIAPFDRS